MAFEFDPDKDALNRERHGIALSDFRGFDAEPATIEDRRRNYDEIRLRAFGRIDSVPYCLVFTYRGENVRLISLRRAGKKEISRYERS